MPRSASLLPGSFDQAARQAWAAAPCSPRSEAAADVSSAIDPAALDQPRPPMPLQPMDISVSRVMPRVGVVNSQPELFEAAGLPAQPTPAMTAQARARTMALLERAASLGVVRLLP